MSKRKSYHTTVKLSYALGIQDKWLPDEFLKKIPRSTAHYWKNESVDKYEGHEYASQVKDNLEDLKLIFDEIMRRERKLFVAIARIKITLVSVLGTNNIKKVFKKNYKQLFDVIERTKDAFDDGVHTIYRFLDINPKTLAHWKTAVTYTCQLSPTHLCLKKVPNQTSVKELNVMKSMLTRARFSNWSIRSVYGYAKRRGWTDLSLNTWYNYNRKHTYRLIPAKGRYKKKYVPLTAEKPNHIWHADVTIVDTLDGNRYYVYLVVDNYSRHWLNWKVHDSISGEIRTQTIKEAIQQEFGGDMGDHSLDLIVDGGSENVNHTIKDFLDQSNINIDRKIALKDIKQSNSLVEASNKTLKYDYLFRQPIKNKHDLIRIMKKTAYDFCYVRPNLSIGSHFQTPYEAHNNIFPTIESKEPRFAIKERICANQASNCKNQCD